MRDTDRLLVVEMLTIPCKPDPRVSLIDMMMMLYSAKRASALLMSIRNCSEQPALRSPTFCPPPVPLALLKHGLFRMRSVCVCIQARRLAYSSRKMRVA